MTFRLTPAAERDLEAIADTIAADNPVAARRWLDRMERQCASLGEYPAMGAARDEVRPGLRLWPLGNHLSLYRERDGGAEIVRVMDGRRQWEHLLDRP